MSKVRIVEGFDMVGKTAIINEYANRLNDYVVYHPDYKLFDKVLSRNLAFMYCYGQVDLLRYLDNSNLKLVYDRAIISSYVYDRIYGNGEHVSYELVKDYFNKLSESVDEIEVIYTSHKNRESARRIYENDKNHNDKLDQFSCFDMYYLMYSSAHLWFYDIIRRLKDDFEDIKFTEIETESLEDGSAVDWRVCK